MNVKILKTKQTHTNSLCGSLDLFAMVFVVQHCFFARPRLQFFQSEASCCDSDDVSGNFFLAQSDGCGIPAQVSRVGTEVPEDAMPTFMMFDVC